MILVPHLNGIEEPCEQGLKALETAGLTVWRRRGSSAIDKARSQMASEVLRSGRDAFMFIDADISFDPNDVIKLLQRPEPVVSGVYPIKGARRFASVFDGVEEVVFGPQAPDSYPLIYAATGFLRIKTDVLRCMVEEFKLPLCDLRWGRGFWPFFQPLVADGHYLSEDWAFSYRLRQMGIVPLADTKIRLYHWGYYGYSWEDAGSPMNRYESYIFRCNYGAKTTPPEHRPVSGPDQQP